MAGAVVAVAAISLRLHAAEALLTVDMPGVAMLAMLEADIPAVAMLAMLEVATPAVPTLEVDMPGAVMLGLEWGRMALGAAGTSPAPAPRIVPGTAPIGLAKIGTAVIGAAETTGMVAIGMARTTGTAAVTGKTIMANGVGGTGTNGVIPTITSCSLAILAFPGGGVGAGAHGPAGAGVTRMDMDITATVILTTAAMVIPTMGTAMGMVMVMDTTDTAPSTSLSTEAAANPELPSCSGDWHALVITTDPLMESWDHKRGGQFGPTSRSTAT